MVPVGVGENKIEMAASLCGQLVAESADTRAGVNYNNVIAFRSDFQTGCISAVF
jgi:hypothetical protein